MENHVKMVPSEDLTLEKQSLLLTLMEKGTVLEEEELEEGGVVVALEEGEAEEEEGVDVMRTEHRGTTPVR